MAQQRAQLADRRLVDVTRLVTSATVWVTSSACCDIASRVPVWVDSAPSVAW